MLTRRSRILAIAAGALAVVATATAVAVRHSTPCEPTADTPPAGDSMKAVVHRCYGGAEVLELATIEKPVPGPNDVLVQVRAVAINPADWHNLTGTPYVIRPTLGFGAPNDVRFGVDYSGVVVGLGANVMQFQLGDAVFGARSGALAEYITANATRTVLPKPANLSFEQAAAIPIAALTALQGLRDHGRIAAGDKVLINGASGGVGTFAVQIAKALGAEVTAVCSTRNVELVRSLGADHVIDYTRENFTERPERYDLILDNVGNHSLGATRRALTADGRLVVVSGPKDNAWLGPLTRAAQTVLTAPFVSHELTFFVATLNRDDLTFLAALAAEGKVVPAIDRSYPLSEVAAAVDYLGTGHARAKVVVTLD